MKSPGKSTVESQKSNAKLLQEKSKIKLLTVKEIKIACHGLTGHWIFLKWKRWKGIVARGRQGDDGW